MISNKLIGEALLRNDNVVSCVFLGKGIFLLRMEGDSLPMKTNSYGVMKTVDPELFNREFSPRIFVVGMDELEVVADTESEVVFGAAAKREFEWLEKNWEEVESDDGHRDLYDDLDLCDTVLE
jgi:hypothetical protein|tara:strand:+ start:249 stop:617 length:369 start_codon:yes stop_codon:yes gene_type:complete